MSKLYDILKPATIELLRIAWNDGTDATGLIAGAFDLENEYVQQVLTDLAKRVKDIDQTTRDTIQEIIGRQASEGWSIEDVRDELLRRSVTESATRATLIARTESAHSYSAGSMAYYEATGQVSGTEWLTFEPCDICTPLSGKVVPLRETFMEGVLHPPAHPNCRCAIAAVVKDSE